MHLWGEVNLALIQAFTHSLKDRAQETTLIAHNESLFRRLGDQFNTLRILIGFPSIVFVVGQAGEAEQAVGDIVGAFGG